MYHTISLSQGQEVVLEEQKQYELELLPLQEQHELELLLQALLLHIDHPVPVVDHQVNVVVPLLQELLLPLLVHIHCQGRHVTVVNVVVPLLQELLLLVMEMNHQVNVVVHVHCRGPVPVKVLLLLMHPPLVDIIHHPMCVIHHPATVVKFSLQGQVLVVMIQHRQVIVVLLRGMHPPLEDNVLHYSQPAVVMLLLLRGVPPLDVLHYPVVLHLIQMTTSIIHLRMMRKGGG